MTHDTTADAVERVAEALYNLNPDYHLTMGRTILKPWQDARGDYKTLARKQARAAIAAMPTPPVAVTEAMVEAGARELQEGIGDCAEVDVNQGDDRVWFTVDVSDGHAKTLSRACLTAALGAQEAPLEEVLFRFNPHGWHFEVNVHPLDVEPCFEVDVYSDGKLQATGTGPTIDDAIRDAVRRAQGGGEG